MSTLQDIRDYAGDLALGTAPMHMLRLALDICGRQTETSHDLYRSVSKNLNDAHAQLKKAWAALEAIIEKCDCECDPGTSAFCAHCTAKSALEATK